MEILAKLTVFAAVGLLLLACNFWFVTAAFQAIARGNLVIAPVKVLGGTGDAAAAGETLARLIIVRLHIREWELQQSQASLKREKQQDVLPDRQEAEASRGVTAGILGTPKIAVLNTQLFEPANINVKVGGVDVGGWLPSLQRWFVQDRILTFAVAWQGKTALVAGNIDALGLGRLKPLWIAIENATENSIADAVALALIHRRYAKDSPEFGELQDDEFASLVNSIGEIARINRRVLTYKVAAKSDFARIFVVVNPLADRIAGWNELSYFAASIAESAENFERALFLYRRVRSARELKLNRTAIEEKIAALERLAPIRDQIALQKMEQHLADAIPILNGLFGKNLKAPPIALKSDADLLNAYWDGTKLNAPPAVQDIPDVIYHEATFAFIQSQWSFKYSGQAGALAGPTPTF